MRSKTLFFSTLSTAKIDSRCAADVRCAGDIELGCVDTACGVRLLVPHESRTYYFFCESEAEQRELLAALKNNIEMLRASESGVQQIISVAQLYGCSREITLLLKEKLRSRHWPAVDPDSPEPFVRALVAILSTDVAALRAVFDAAPPLDPSATWPHSKQTLLFYAIRNGDVESVQLLIDKGVPVNAVNVVGDTALIVVSRHGQRDIVRLLLEYGADRGLANSFKETALSEAATPDISDLVHSYFPRIKRIGQ